MSSTPPSVTSLPLSGTHAGQNLVPELVVISGKGGTGKTSVTASFAVIAEGVVVADCDVDAADLHLVLDPEILERHVFRSGHEAVVRKADCDGCGDCLEVCRFGALVARPGVTAPLVDAVVCEGCGVCVHICPRRAIDFTDRTCGEWFVSDTRAGPMVHARLGIAAENSGKLVSTVRTAARSLAVENGRGLILVDGPPGIGCPVISSITGATAVLIVTEPSVSGVHDLERVLSLTRHFGIPAAVCVNRWDLDADACRRIERLARSAGAECYIGHGAILRGDYGRIVVGQRSAIEEGVIVHARPEDETVIGDRVTVGHGAMIHNARIENGATIGMRSVISDFSVVGENALIGEQALVRRNQKVPPRAIAVEVPARVAGEVGPEQSDMMVWAKQVYVDLAHRCPAGLREITLEQAREEGKHES